DVGGDHFLHLALLEQQADAEVVHSGVVADDGEVLRALALDGGDKVFRDAAEAESAHENGGSVVELGDGGVSGSDAFVHRKWSVVSGKSLVSRKKKQEIRFGERALKVRGVPPCLFSELRILKDLQEPDFVTAHSKGVTARNCGTAHFK